MPGSDAGTDRTLAITVNGEPFAAAVGWNAEDVVVALGLDRRPLAVEVNRHVVPRARLRDCMLSGGDCIEIVTLVGGG